MDYNRIFQNRGALTEEFRTAVRALELRQGHDLLISTASIGDQLPAGVPHHCFATTSPIPFPTGSTDRILCLTGLHNSSQEERTKFYAECLRVLKPGGKLVVGDVRTGSNQAQWLNVYVHLFNSKGCRGRFFSRPDADAMLDSGFAAVDIVTESYNWNFKNSAEMVDFCRNLFGLDLASDSLILFGLTEYLRPVKTKHGEAKIPWELIYFTATKSENE
jgi:SAM-dependent methyltransferase